MPEGKAYGVKICGRFGVPSFFKMRSRRRKMHKSGRRRIRAWRSKLRFSAYSLDCTSKRTKKLAGNPQVPW